MLGRLKADIAGGKPINELELVYLPLFNSVKFTPAELFKESAKLVKVLQTDDYSKRKIHALAALLVGKVVDKATIRAILEEVNMEGNAFVEVLEEIGTERGRLIEKEDIAQKMLLEGYKSSIIIKITGIDIDRLDELRNTLHVEAV